MGCDTDTSSRSSLYEADTFVCMLITDCTETPYRPLDFVLADNINKYCGILAAISSSGDVVVCNLLICASLESGEQ